MASRRIPKRVGPYMVHDKLAAGGMGEVLLATHNRLQRPTALKRLIPPKDADPVLLEEMKERFDREGMVLAQFHHQAICGVYDLFTWRSVTYLALEYVDGFDLRTLIQARQVPIDVALIVAVQIAEALEHAHKYGIIHRDVKPANIMISRTGDVKLMDFGIARGDELEVLTRTGMFIGTPSYTAPEVLAGGDAEAQADVYSLAAAIYRCVAGRPLFPADLSPEVRYRLIFDGEIEPLAEVRPEVPEEVALVVHRGLAVDVTQRFPSMAAFRRALELALFSAEVQVDHTKRLVGFLRNAGLITEEEIDTATGPKAAVVVVEDTDPEALLVPRRGRWGMVLGLVVVIGVAIAVAGFVVEPEAWQAVVDWVQAQLAGS